MELADWYLFKRFSLFYVTITLLICVTSYQDYFHNKQRIMQILTHRMRVSETDCATTLRTNHVGEINDWSFTFKIGSRIADTNIIPFRHAYHITVPKQEAFDRHSSLKKFNYIFLTAPPLGAPRRT